MGNRQNLLVFMFFVAELCGEGLSHKCIHDEIAARYPRSSIPHLRKDDGARDRRQADTYSPYRMTTYFVMENFTNPDTILPLLNDPNGALQLAIGYLQDVLSVVRATGNLIIPPQCTSTSDDGQCTGTEIQMCGPHATVPDEHLGNLTVCDPTCREAGGNNTGVDSDFIFYVSVVNDSDCSGGTLAYASNCYLDEVNNRPLAGFTNICPESLESVGRRSLFLTILHETLHAVGFNIEDFNNFVDQNGERFNGVTTLTINGEVVNAVNTAKVLSYGRDYYSCPTLQGVLLENEGGGGSANSHWEARTLSYEIMIASSTPLQDNYSSISNFTLNVLEDSGWYKVNYAVAESLYNYELLWGRGLGCSFITADCSGWPYSCTPPSDDTLLNGCSYDYQAASYCDTDGFHDDCFFFSPYSNGFCNAPEALITSSCFPLMDSGTPDGSCYDRQCYRHSSTQELFYTVTRSGTTRWCPDGRMLTYSDGVELTCPPTDLICARNTSVSMFDSTGDVPSSWCHSSCATCSRPGSLAHCLTCIASLSLSGEAPSVCTSDSCAGGEYLDSSGNCVACATGCRACGGSRITDCWACEDETLYRITTTQRASQAACVTADRCTDTDISVFGDRTCGGLRNTNQGGGASSIHYQHILMLFLLMGCLLV